MCIARFGVPQDSCLLGCDYWYMCTDLPSLVVRNFCLISMPLFGLRMQLKCAVAGVFNGRGECVIMCWCWDSNNGILQWHFPVVFGFDATFKVFTVLMLRILVFLNIGAVCQDPRRQNGRCCMSGSKMSEMTVLYPRKCESLLSLL